MNRDPAGKQRGAILVVSLILLAVITLLTVTAQNLSTTNLKTVGNMQTRDEAIAAANQAIARVLSSSFTLSPKERAYAVDIDHDGNTDYTVTVAVPTCLSALPIKSTAPSSVNVEITATTGWNTTWDLDASIKATDNAGGAVVRVRCGVRVLVLQTIKPAACPQ
ncbi:pilus assembly PilX N-terminal domain-containing protein [uncultured Thiodictyon sp.]|uniref:pilus assembly PilX family protein n=1 Tax=uncultured Thiodictyon sp. TaxID=1846217 RepID=UPI0025CFD9F9|nr:pilus assembly PilX N-terminal domain-containing protein [uncultured Thiodictyon sp.]